MAERPTTDDRLGVPDRGLPPLRSAVVELVEGFLAALFTDDDAAAAMVGELRDRAEDVAVAIARLESDCAGRGFPRRWALVYSATVVEHDAMLPFLREVVLQPIGHERSADPHSFSTVKEETVLRTTAAEGVAALARQGNERARHSLFEFLSLDSISIRRASAQALVAIDPALRDEILDHLPRDARHLVDLRQVAVTDVPQIEDPSRHLRRKRPEKVPGPPPFEPNARTTAQTPPRAGG